MKRKKLLICLILLLGVYLILLIINILPNDFHLISNKYIDMENLGVSEKSEKNILKNKEKYPEDLLEMLSRNEDMLDYVLDYPNKKGKVYSDNVGKVTKGSFPLLLQYDKRWGYAYYGDNVIAINGCGPTVLSMVITGLTGDNTITPYVIAKYAAVNGYYQKDYGTSWYLMTEGVKKFGINGKNITLSKTSIFSELENGHPIVCSMRKGDFTTLGHFILLVGIKNGKIIVNDPNSRERSSKLWTYEKLEGQIKNLWSFSLDN